MATQNEFDDIFRQKYSEKEFVFNEENWERAERALDKEKRKRKAIWWAVALSVGILAGALMMFVVLKNNQYNQLTKNNNDNTLYNNKMKDQKNNIKSKKHTDIKEAQVKKDFNPVKKTETTFLTTIENRKLEENTSKIIEKQEIYDTLKDVNLPPTPAAKTTKKTLNKSTHPLIKEAKSNKTVHNAKIVEEKIVERDSKKENKSAMIYPVQKNDSFYVNAMPLKIINLEKDSLHEATLRSIVLDSIIILKNNKIVASNDSLHKKIIIAINFGGNFVLGWKYENHMEARGVNPFGGLIASYPINKKWSSCIALQYEQIGYLNQSEKTFSNPTYDFGYSSIDTTIDPKSLYYGSLQPLFIYQLNEKNGIGMFGSLSYLINAKSTIIVNNLNGETPTTNSLSKTISSTNQFGYYSGAFNSWNASVGILYTRKVSKKINLQTMFNFGLLDIKNNSFFMKEAVERGSGLKISLSYDLFNL